MIARNCVREPFPWNGSPTQGDTATKGLASPAGPGLAALPYPR